MTFISTKALSESFTCLIDFIFKITFKDLRFDLIYLSKLQQIFTLFDVDGDGKLNKNEAKMCLAWNFNLNPEMVDDARLERDQVLSENIEMMEFVRKMNAQMNSEEQKRLKENWNMIKGAVQDFFEKYD